MFIIDIEEIETIKEKLLKTIKKFFDNANYDDIMESIYVQQMITKGIEQLDNGEFISHDDVKERFRK